MPAAPRRSAHRSPSVRSGQVRVAFSPDGAILATALIHAVDTGASRSKFEFWDATTHRPGSTAPFPSGRKDHGTRIQPGRSDPGSGRRRRIRRALGRPWPEVARTDQTPFGRSFQSVAISPDGNVLATGDSHGVIQFWDLASHRSIWESSAANTPITSLAFSADGEIWPRVAQPLAAEPIGPSFSGTFRRTGSSASHSSTATMA